MTTFEVKLSVVNVPDNTLQENKNWLAAVPCSVWNVVLYSGSYLVKGLLLWFL